MENMKRREINYVIRTRESKVGGDRWPSIDVLLADLSCAIIAEYMQKTKTLEEALELLREEKADLYEQLQEERVRGLLSISVDDYI